MNNQRPGFDLSIGMMLPSGNLVAEQQMQQMLAPRVALHSTRLWPILFPGWHDRCLLNNWEEGGGTVPFFGWAWLGSSGNLQYLSF